MERPKHRDDVLTEPFEDQAVVVDLVSGEYHTLNQTSVTKIRGLSGAVTASRRSDQT
jgi:hypothetical protein